MTSYSALSPVSAGIYTALNVAALLALAPGGVGDDIAQSTGYPFVLYVVNLTPIHGLGSQPGRAGFMTEVGIRLHVFSQYEGGQEAESVNNAAMGALFTAFDPVAPTVAITGFKTCDLVWDDTPELLDSLVAGLKVKELVSLFTMRLELQ